MPEIPDLEVVRRYLKPRLQDHTITATSVPIPWIVRTGADGLQDLVGHQFVDILRHGKYLLFNLDDGHVLVVNDMLTGRFHWDEAGAKRIGRLAVVIAFDDQNELRYLDMRRMGRFYLTTHDELDVVPQFAKLGPDVFAIDDNQFTALIAKRRGPIKNTFTNQEFFASIGNAYLDEILWEARLHPHRKRSTMNDQDIHGLYQAINAILDRSCAIVDEIVQYEGLGKKAEWREHLSVHRKAGEPCPRCGTLIKGQARSGSETNYCVQCQPLFALSGGDSP
jgi:formamidopyrimidine-DNA glycosylase